MLSQPPRPLRVLSLFDSTGTWASFAPPGAEVYAVDMQPRPLEWSRARGVVHVQARIKPDPLDGEEIRFEPGDLTVRDAVKRWPRPAKPWPVSGISPAGRGAHGPVCPEHDH